MLKPKSSGGGIRSSSWREKHRRNSVNTTEPKNPRYDLYKTQPPQLTRSLEEPDDNYVYIYNKKEITIRTALYKLQNVRAAIQTKGLQYIFQIF
jgi:hypothetical protein